MPMRIMVLGLRGFPGIQGGVETHAEFLYPMLAQRGCQVEVLVRTPYWPKDKEREWQGIRFRPLWSPRSKGLEAFLHSFLGVLYAGIKRPDILHIHAIGPALVTPLARLLGLRVVVTHHGPDYDREKWGWFSRRILRLGERCAARFANQMIVISGVIKQLILSKYHRDTIIIPNGVVVSEAPQTIHALQQFSLERGRYVLTVSRFVPEKRHGDLIRAFAAAGLTGWKLVLVGSLEPADDYIGSIRTLVKDEPDIVLTGFQSGMALRELYANAGLFVLPSSHEGLPIALLEALSYGLCAIASDIPANLEINLPARQYFPLGDVHALADVLQYFGGAASVVSNRDEIKNWVSKQYNWEDIAEQTLVTYKSMLHRQSAICR